jgi:hypothetical protein
MSASPQAVWELVSDVTNTGRFSPETFEAEWIDGSTGPAVGARFRGHVKRNGKGPTYWTKCTVTECEPGKVFTFGVDGRPGGQPVNTWRYEFAATGGDSSGTDVTESFTLSNMLPFRLYWMVMGRLRGRTNVNGMRTTLERIKAVVESDTKK